MNRLGLVIAIVLIAAVAVVGFVYFFGVPQQGAVASAAVPASPVPAGGAADAAVAESSAQQTAAEAGTGDERAKVPGDAVAPPADPSALLAIQIPGCVCHSKDQKLVKQHAAYRMNQCAGCHVGGVPTGQ